MNSAERDAHLDRGVAALETDAFDVAFEAYRRALELDAASPLAHANRAWTYHLTGRYAAAIAACKTAIALRPDLAFAHVNLALSYLVCGDFERGWNEYEWMWHDPARRALYPSTDRVPRWNGAPFAGKRLVIARDQGFGDAIQMARYLPAIKARGGHVILEVNAPLVPLFANLPGIDELRVPSGPDQLADDADLWIPILDIPRVMATRLDTIPASVWYLNAPADRVPRWRARLQRPARLRVGIAWAGSAQHANDRRRSIRLEDFAAIGGVDDIAFYGLQKGRDEDCRSSGAFTFDPLGAEIRDFADTAAIIAQLDLVIAVDTSIVHLAGALGKPVWTLLPFAPDWRWLVGRGDSPWYPTMRLFRQPAPGDWAPVIAEVARELRCFERSSAVADTARPVALAGRGTRDTARLHYDRAVAMALAGNVRDAITTYETAVTLAPDFAEAQSNLGTLYLQAGRGEDALRAYAEAVRIEPDHAALQCNLAMVLIELQRYDEAVAALKRALAVAPDLYEAHINLSCAYRRSGRANEALAPARRAVALRADRDAYANLAGTAFEADALDLAVDAYRRALERDAGSAELHSSLGWVYHVQGRYAEAIATLRAAIALAPEFALAHVNLGLSLLVCGDVVAGWDEYAWVWRLTELRRFYPYLESVPRWNGTSFAGRTLLISVDQGFGDAVQMVRFLPAVKARGGRVVLEVRPALAALFANLPGVDDVRVQPGDAQVSGDIDLHIPLLGLPGALGIDLDTLPARSPYLTADPARIARWRPRLAGCAGSRVGLVWSGSPDHANDRRRSMPLAALAPLAAIEGIAWFGLQKGRDEEIRSCGPLQLDPLGPEMADFADTAAIIAQLDLVIAVDTSVVHVAGALGVPVWTLLPFAPDWRWLLGRDDSPWYPTMRLFRQPAAGDWASVVAHVAGELREWVARREFCAPTDSGGASGGAPLVDVRAEYERAKSCASRGDVDAAIAAYESVIAREPGFAEALSNLGNLYVQTGRRDDGLRAYERAIQANPMLASIHCNRAALLIDLGRLAEAIAAAQRAVELAPDLYEGHVTLCRAFATAGRDRDALAPALRALASRPDRDAYIDLGVAAFGLGALDIVIEANQRALELDANSALAQCSLGAAYHLSGRYSEAIAASQAATALEPQLASAHLNLALSHLVCGDLKRGWDEYAWVWRVKNSHERYPYLDRVTLWNGEDFAGRQLLVTPDQGFGDAIQMARYLPAVKARGGRVILDVQAPLAALFADLPGVDELRVHTGAADLIGVVDRHIPMLGLPRVLATDLDTIPAPIPYLYARRKRIERWRPRLRSAAPLRIGIAWAGSPANDNDRRRSVRLDDFAELGDIRGVAWFGLQKGRDELRCTCGSLTLDPLGPEIRDFADTAAIIAQLDLVIAVDTAIVHLAGALGKTVWTLLPFAPDWRWLRERNDSPWYPTMRLFRQPVLDDWAAVFSEVGRALRAYVNGAR